MPGLSHKKAALAVAAAAVLLFSFAQDNGAEAGDEVGHALAEKFAGAAREAEERKAAEEAARAAEEAAEDARADEAWMLEQAKKEAAEREAREAADRAAAEAATRVEAERRALAFEQEKEIRRLEEARRLEEERLAKEAEQKRLAAEREADAGRRAEEARRALEAEREEEARRLIGKIKRIEQERAEARRAAERSAEGKQLDMPTGSTEIGKAPVTAPAESVPIVATTRVTVLLILDVKMTGIRRFGPKTADPVVCNGARCWVSAGPERDAVLMARGKALGPGNTLGRRAAACNHKLACAFRSVELGAEWAALQPIDLRIMRHDRRPELSVRADRSCDFDGLRLSCATLYRAADWRAWIVPEPIAIKAGPDALNAALDSGLPPARAADAGRVFEQR